MKRTAALLVALVGAAFCALAALGVTEAICVTAGCAVFKGTTVLGIDLYWIGATFFLLLAALLALPSMRRTLARPLVWLVVLGLALDTILLAMQAVSLSCLNCLVFAVLLGVVAALLLPGPPVLRKVLAVWAVLLVAALAGLLRDGLSPVAIHGDEDAAIKVFFAPSCPACREELTSLAARPELHGLLALYPIARDDGDLRGILRFRRVLDHGGDLPAAVEACFSRAEAGGPEPGLSDSLSLRLASFRNKVFLARAGAASIPYVLTTSPALLHAGPRPEGQPAAPGRAGPEDGARAVPAAPDEGCGYTRDDICPDYPQDGPQAEPQAEPVPDLFGPGPAHSPVR